GTDNDREAVIGAGKNVVKGVPGAQHGARRGVGARMLAHHLDGADDFLDGTDTKVVGRFKHLDVSWDFSGGSQKTAASEVGRLASGLAVSCQIRSSAR